MPTDPYTPTTEDVRESYIHNTLNPVTDAAEFDRWLAQTVAAALEKAADEMEGEILRDGGLSVRGVFRVKSYNWLRARAETIREKGLTA